MPPRSPQALVWEETRGKDPAQAADQWLREALRRAPSMKPLLARRSAIALRLAGEALAGGDIDSCRAFLQRALLLESRLAGEGSPSSLEWVEVLKRLLDLASRPRPWPAREVQSLRQTGAGALFLESAGIRGP